MRDFVDFLVRQVVEEGSYEIVVLEDDNNVEIKVLGNGAVLQGFGSADPRAIGSYDDTTWKTFDGYVMAVVRAGREAGEIKVTFTAEDCEPKTVTIAVE